MNKIMNEANNAPVSFLGGVIAVCGLLYSSYVFLLNGDFPNLPFGNHVFKLLILILVEAPLAYFFVQIHVKMAEKGHGIPLFFNLFTILVSALVSCFNVAILSYQSMLDGSMTYFVIMVVFSLFCALYLLITEIHKQKTEIYYIVDLDALSEFREKSALAKLWKRLSPLSGRHFSSMEERKSSINEATEDLNRDEEFKKALKLVKEEKVSKIPEVWDSWVSILVTAYICAFVFSSYSVFPEVYGKACMERFSSGESLEVLNNHKNSCDDYITFANPK